MTFEDFKFDEQVLEGLRAMNFKEPTPVQEQAIPKILENNDLIACAQTGTGKTAAYLLPVLNKIITNKSKEHSVNTLILVPTRELAIQIDKQLEGFSYFLDISSMAVYGGTGGEEFDRQKKALKAGADIIIATPGKIISHLGLGYVKIDKLEHLILDEADRMLDMGFVDDIMQVISYLPKKRQTLLFSATMPREIRELSKKILQNPAEVDIAISKPAEGILQAAYMVYNNQKIELVNHLLKGKENKSIIIFASTRQSVKDIEKDLKQLKLSVASIHSDLEQDEREEVLRLFRNQKVRILVATDVISRGIDIVGIDLIINFDVPQDAEDYIHRVGRTARAKATGVALTFINDKDVRRFNKIEKLIGSEVNKVPLPPHLGEGPEYKITAGRGGSKNNRGRDKKKRWGGKRN